MSNERTKWGRLILTEMPISKVKFFEISEQIFLDPGGWAALREIARLVVV